MYTPRGYEKNIDYVRVSGQVLDPLTFSISPNLGEVNDSFKATDVDLKDRKVVIHIQDAHCNFGAQKAIYDIIKHIDNEYGVDIINLEGGSGRYDLSPFTSIEDKDLREKVSLYFADQGLLNGAELYAVNNPDKVSLWGVEDPKLYVENLKIYRDSLQYKDKADEYIKNLSYIMDNLKRHIYSKDLMELDAKYTAYKEQNLDFRDYLDYLINKTTSVMIDIKQFPNIYLLSLSLKEEKNIDFEKANKERDALIDLLHKMLSKRDLEELVLKTVKFKKEGITATEFYEYLIEKAKSVDVTLEDYPDLRKYVVYVSLYSSIDKSVLMDEISKLEDSIKEVYFENDQQRELSELSKNLVILRNIFNIALTKNDYLYYKKNKESFNVENFKRFIDKTAPKYKITTPLDKDIDQLDIFRNKIEDFFKYSFDRDLAFIGNMRFSRGTKYTNINKNVAIIITGGFHSENLCELFRKEKVSYISIIPKFTNPEGYKSPYFDILAGGEAPIERTIDEALSQMQVASMLNDLGVQVNGEMEANRFRLAVDIVKTVLQDKPFLLVTPAADIVFQRQEDGEITAKAYSPEGYESEWGKLKANATVRDLVLLKDLPEKYLPEAKVSPVGHIDSERSLPDYEMPGKRRVFADFASSVPDSMRGKKEEKAVIFEPLEEEDTLGLEEEEEVSVDKEFMKSVYEDYGEVIRINFEIFPVMKSKMTVGELDKLFSMMSSMYDAHKKLILRKASKELSTDAYKKLVKLVEEKDKDSLKKIKELPDETRSKIEPIWSEISAIRNKLSAIKEKVDNVKQRQNMTADQQISQEIIDLVVRMDKSPQKVTDIETVHQMVNYLHQRSITLLLETADKAKAKAKDMLVLSKKGFYTGDIEKIRQTFEDFGRNVVWTRGYSGISIIDVGKTPAVYNGRINSDTVRALEDNTDILTDKGMNTVLIHNDGQGDVLLLELGQHTADLVVDYSSPEDGGMIQLRFKDWKNEQVDPITVQMRLDFLAAVLGEYGMGVKVDRDDFFITAKMDKDHGLKNAGQIKEILPKILRVLIKTEHLNTAFNSPLRIQNDIPKRLESLERQKEQLQKEGVALSDPRMVTLDSDISEVKKEREAAAKRAVEKHVKDYLMFGADYEIISEAKERKKLMRPQQREAFVPTYYDRVDTVLEENHLESINKKLISLGLDPIPGLTVREENGTPLISQAQLDMYVNEPVKRMLDRGELIINEEGGISRNDENYTPLRDVIIGFPDAENIGKRLTPESRKRVNDSMQMGVIVESMGSSIDFEPQEVIGGLLSEVGVFVPTSGDAFKDGNRYRVTALRNETGRVVFADVSLINSDGTFKKLNYKEFYEVLDMKEDVDSLVQVLSDPVMNSALKNLIAEWTIEEDTAYGHGVSKGLSDVLEVTFQKRTKFDDKKKRVLLTPFTEPEDSPYFDQYGGIVTSGGSVNSHAGITSREKGIPAVILTNVWQVVRDGETIWELVDHAPVQETATSINGFTVYKKVKAVPRQIKKGTLVKVDGTNGRLIFVGERGPTEEITPSPGEGISRTFPGVARVAESFGNIKFVDYVGGRAPYVQNLSSIQESEAGLTGAKAYNLKVLSDLAGKIGFGTAEGVVVTTEAFREFIDNIGARERIEAILGDKTSGLSWKEKHRRIENLLKGLQEETGESLTGDEKRRYDTAVGVLSGHITSSGMQLEDTSSYAVRSSNISEDAPDAAFAGVGDTELNVEAGKVIETVIENFASFSTERAIMYRLGRADLAENFEIGHAVVIQRMVPAEKAGVIFTRNSSAKTPEERDRRTINAAYGFGEGVVGGLNADTYVTNLENEEVERYTPGYKRTKYVNSPDGGTEEVIVKGDTLVETEILRNKRVLTAAQVTELSRIAGEIEAFYNKAMDIEFAIDADGKISILQARPDTTMQGFSVSEADVLGRLIELSSEFDGRMSVKEAEEMSHLFKKLASLNIDANSPVMARLRDVLENNNMFEHLAVWQGKKYPEYRDAIGEIGLKPVHKSTYDGIVDSFSNRRRDIIKIASGEEVAKRSMGGESHKEVSDDDFISSIEKQGGFWVVSADGPKARWTNEYLGEEGADEWLELLRSAAREFKESHFSPGFHAHIPEKGSDEFWFAFSRDYSRDEIEREMAELLKIIKKYAKKYDVIYLDRKLSDKEKNEIEAIQKANGEEATEETKAAVANVFSPRETTILVKANSKTARDLKNKFSGAEVSSLRVPYMPMGVARSRIIEGVSESFKQVGGRADNIQKRTKNRKAGEGGKIITFDEDLLTEALNRLIDIASAPKNRKRYRSSLGRLEELSANMPESVATEAGLFTYIYQQNIDQYDQFLSLFFEASGQVDAEVKDFRANLSILAGKDLLKVIRNINIEETRTAEDFLDRIKADVSEKAQERTELANALAILASDPDSLGIEFPVSLDDVAKEQDIIDKRVKGLRQQISKFSFYNEVYDKQLEEKRTTTEKEKQKIMKEAIDTVNGCYTRGFLQSILTDLNANKGLEGTFLIRGPPDNFYAIIAKGGSVGLFKINHSYILPVEIRKDKNNRYGKAWEKAVEESGREPESMRESDLLLDFQQPQYGFKIPKTIFGDHEGDVIIKIIANRIYESVDNYRKDERVSSLAVDIDANGQVAGGESIADSIQKGVTDILGRGENKFYTNVQMSYVTANMLTGETKNINTRMIEEVEMPLYSRNYILGDSRTTGGNLFKHYRTYSSKRAKNEIGRRLERAQGFALARARENLAEYDENNYEKVNSFYEEIKDRRISDLSNFDGVIDIKRFIEYLGKTPPAQLERKDVQDEFNERISRAQRIGEASTAFLELAIEYDFTEEEYSDLVQALFKTAPSTSFGMLKEAQIQKKLNLEEYRQAMIAAGEVEVEVKKAIAAGNIESALDPVEITDDYRDKIGKALDFIRKRTLKYIKDELGRPLSEEESSDIEVAIDALRQKRGGELEYEEERMLVVPRELEEALAEQRIYLFNARVDSPDSYCLGFRTEGVVGLSSELLESLSDRDLAEYIFHETFGEEFISHGELYGKEGVRDRRDSPQGKIFGLENRLKTSLRGFIDSVSMSKARGLERMEVAAGKDIFEVAMTSEERSSPKMREAVDIESGSTINRKISNVKVIAGVAYDPGMENIIRKLNREFNRDIRLKFGSHADNQQMRLFSMFTDDLSTIKSFLREVLRSNSGLSSDERLIVYTPEVKTVWSSETTEPVDIKKALSDWIYSNRDKLELDFSSDELDLLVNDVLSEENEQVVLIKDTYSDARDRDGQVRLPDIGLRFILARHIDSFMRAKDDANRNNEMQKIIDLLSVISGDEELREKLEKVGSGDLQKFLNAIIVSAEPINYAELQQYEDMLAEVARSL